MTVDELREYMIKYIGASAAVTQNTRLFIIAELESCSDERVIEIAQFWNML